MIELRGCGLGPWNVERYRLGSGPSGRPLVDGEDAVFFHFHAFRIHDDGTYRFAPELYRVGEDALALFYRPYVQAIEGSRAEVAAVDPSFRHGLVRPEVPPRFPRRAYRQLRTLVGGALRRWMGPRRA